MGTTVSNLQILGASLEDVRTALPRALVGQWSERFVTACPDLSPRNAERRAASLSKKLDCTLLLVSMFDGDALWLTVYQSGKRLTSHVALPENCKAGNPKLFCSALGLPEELAPKLKRLFTDCAMQEKKLGILQALLGAPLFVRWDDPEDRFPTEPVQADTQPLERWLKEHPAPPKPPKIKNQCKAELVQEFTDVCFNGYLGGKKFLFRPLLHVYDESEEEREWLKKMGHKYDDILGAGLSGGKLAHLLPDGQLELTPMEDPHITKDLEMYLFERRDVIFDHFIYGVLGDRLITAASFYAECGFHSYSPYQTVVLRDSAGSLPCYLPLVAEGKPVFADKLYLIPDGGFLVYSQPEPESFYNLIERPWGCITRYGPDGQAQYTVGSEADLRAEDIAGLCAVREDQRQISSGYHITDRQGRLWMCSEKYVECYFPENKLISRHRLPGGVTALYCNDDGQACAVSFDWKKYILRVYRFT